MTREELKEHCKKQIEMCEMWAKAKGENPCGKIYEEHKMILELLEQEPCEDCISRQEVKDMLMREWTRYIPMDLDVNLSFVLAKVDELPSVTPQYTEAEIQKMQELEQAEIQKAYELGKAQEPCEDAISRQVAINIVEDMHDLARADVLSDAVKRLKEAPSVTPQPKTGRCKDCKHFEYDSVAKVDGVPLIVAHEICSRWGDGCKTSEDGYCFLFEPKMQEVQE